jgi:hypothetical protein
MRGTLTRRLALAGSGSVLGLLALAPLAAAQTTAPDTTQPAPVAPITLSPQESQQVCSDWVPRLEKRVDNLTARINGGPEVQGSLANLKARAQDARAKGHTDQANRLDQRAQKRQSRIGELANAKQKLDAFAAAHCKPAAPTTTPTK